MSWFRTISRRVYAKKWIVLFLLLAVPAFAEVAQLTQSVRLKNTSGTMINPATEGTLSALNGKVTACNTGAVSGTVSITPGGSPIPVSGPLTNAELRASPLSMSASSLPLPSGACTETTLAALKSYLESLQMTTSGQTGLKVMIVGLGDVFLDPVQLATLTPPAAITGYATETTLGLIKSTDGIKKIVDPVTIVAVTPIPITGSVSVSSVPTTTVQGTITVSSVSTPVPVTDNGGSLTVGGTVAISSIATPVPITASAAIPISSVRETCSRVTNSATFSASQTNQALWTPASGKKFRIYDISVSCSAAGSITLFDNTNSAANLVTPTISCSANGGMVMDLTKSFLSSAVNNVLKYTTGSGSAGSVVVHGCEE